MEIKRKIESSVRESLSSFPVVGILGPRQVGKTTLAKTICRDFADSLYLDLERPSDLARLTDAQFFLREHQGKLICLDEVQRRPEIFPVLRSLVDERRRPGRFLVLGSTSPELLRQASETLAGRIAYHELKPFFIDEMSHKKFSWRVLLERGGFPDSLFAKNSQVSLSWRENFLSTFMERDLSLMGFDCSPSLMRRLWLMLAHCNGQVMNYSKLGQSLDVTHPTIKRYLDILTGSFMLFRLDPYEVNLKKRLVKAAKYYLSDSGVFNSLLDLEEFSDLYNHPGFGSVWEGFAIRHILERFQPKPPIGFFRSHQGEEIDLLFSKRGKLQAFEFKTSSNPNLDSHLQRTMDSLAINTLHVVTPESDSFPLFSGRVRVQSLATLLAEHTAGRGD
ncbi:MAG: ATP-binding protein [Deltaproteobacteria bacterium]|nr:ATP-binding protein [Deltaproteobacteria bacterium]